jgi:hypothetical protein
VVNLTRTFPNQNLFQRKAVMSLDDLTHDQKFHSFALLRCRDHKSLTNPQLLKHFGVRTLIESIAKSSNERRADLVQRCTGIKRNSALKMDATASISMIETALDEQDTNADEVFDEKNGGISTEEIVRYFPLDQVFDLWFHSGFITTETDDDKAFMADIYDFVIQHKLLGEMTALQLVQDLGIVHFVSDKCPIELRTKLLEKVLTYGEPMLAKARPDASSANAAKAKPFTAADLLIAIRPTDLVRFIPLAHMSRPIYALAAAKGWMKVQAVLPPGALDSELPPAPTSGTPSEAPPASPDDAELDAMLAQQGVGDGEAEVVIEADGADDVTTVGPRPGLEVPRPPPLNKKDKKAARG